MAEELQPEEFAQAATAAIADAAGRDARGVARVLADAGLTGVCAAESVGGLGLNIAFALPIATAAGRAQLAFPLIEQMLLAKALGGSPQAAALVSGERLGTWALDGCLQDGWAGHARGAADADWALVKAERAGPEGLGGAVLVALEAGAVEQDGSLDPEHPQSWLKLQDAQVLARIEPAAMEALWRDLHLLVAGYVNGIASAALARTVEHTSTRVQFGKTLASNQAVRHDLARMCLVTESIDASVHRLLKKDEYGHTRDAEPVLGHAIAQAAWVLERAIHLHGGMGFTWDLPLHRGLREIRKFDAAFGAGALQRWAGQDFISACA